MRLSEIQVQESQAPAASTGGQRLSSVMEEEKAPQPKTQPQTQIKPGRQLYRPGGVQPELAEDPRLAKAYVPQDPETLRKKWFYSGAGYAGGRFSSGWESAGMATAGMIKRYLTIPALQALGKDTSVHEAKLARLDQPRKYGLLSPVMEQVASLRMMDAEDEGAFAAAAEGWKGAGLDVFSFLTQIHATGALLKGAGLAVKGKAVFAATKGSKLTNAIANYANVAKDPRTWAQLGRVGATRFAFTPGDTKERLKGAAWAIAYNATPFLVNPTGLSGLHAIGADTALNSLLSMASFYKPLVDQYGGMENATKDPNFWAQVSTQGMTDLMFSIGTRGMLNRDVLLDQRAAQLKATTMKDVPMNEIRTHVSEVEGASRVVLPNASDEDKESLLERITKAEPKKVEVTYDWTLNAEVKESKLKTIANATSDQIKTMRTAVNTQFGNGTWEKLPADAQERLMKADIKDMKQILTGILDNTMYWVTENVVWVNGKHMDASEAAQDMGRNGRSWKDYKFVEGDGTFAGLESDRTRKARAAMQGDVDRGTRKRQAASVLADANKAGYDKKKLEERILEAGKDEIDMRGVVEEAVRVYEDRDGKVIPVVKRKDNSEWNDKEYDEWVADLQAKSRYGQYEIREDGDTFRIEEGKDVGIIYKAATLAETGGNGASAVRTGGKSYVLYNAKFIDDLYTGKESFPKGHDSTIYKQLKDINEFRRVVIDHERLHHLLRVGNGKADHGMATALALRINGHKTLSNAFREESLFKASIEGQKVKTPPAASRGVKTGGKRLSEVIDDPHNIGGGIRLSEAMGEKPLPKAADIEQSKPVEKKEKETGAALKDRLSRQNLKKYRALETRNAKLDAEIEAKYVAIENARMELGRLQRGKKDSAEIAKKYEQMVQLKGQLAYLHAANKQIFKRIGGFGADITGNETTYDSGRVVGGEGALERQTRAEEKKDYTPLEKLPYNKSYPVENIEQGRPWNKSALEAADDVARINGMNLDFVGEKIKQAGYEVRESVIPLKQVFEFQDKKIKLGNADFVFQAEKMQHLEKLSLIIDHYKDLVKDLKARAWTGEDRKLGNRAKYLTRAKASLKQYQKAFDDEVALDPVMSDYFAKMKKYSDANKAERQVWDNVEQRYDDFSSGFFGRTAPDQVPSGPTPATVQGSVGLRIHDMLMRWDPSRQALKSMLGAGEISKFVEKERAKMHSRDPEVRRKAMWRENELRGEESWNTFAVQRDIVEPTTGAILDIMQKYYPVAYKDIHARRDHFEMFDKLITKMLEEIIVNPKDAYEGKGKYGLSDIGKAVHDAGENGIALGTGKYFVKQYPEMIEFVGGLIKYGDGRQSDEGTRLKGTLTQRPQEAYLSLDPTPQKSLVSLAVWLKGEEVKARDRLVAAKQLDAINLGANIKRGFAHKEYDYAIAQKVHKEYRSADKRSEMSFELQQKSSDMDDFEGRTKENKLVPIMGASMSQGRYHKDAMDKLALNRFFSYIGQIANPDHPDIPLIVYEGKMYGGEKMTNARATSLHYVEMKNAPSLALKQGNNFRPPLVHRSMQNMLETVWRPPTTGVMNGLLKTWGMVKRHIMYTPMIYAFQSGSSTWVHQPDNALGLGTAKAIAKKGIWPIVSGEMFRGTFKAGRDILQRKDTTANRFLGYPKERLELAIKSNLGAIRTDNMMRMLYDATTSEVDPRLRTPYQQGLEFIKFKGGLDKWAFENYLAKQVFETWNWKTDQMMKSGMDEKSAGRSAASFINNISGLADKGIYNSDVKGLLQLALLARDYTVTFGRQITGAFVPGKLHHRLAYGSDLGKFGLLSRIADPLWHKELKPDEINAMASSYAGQILKVLVWKMLVINLMQMALGQGSSFSNDKGKRTLIKTGAKYPDGSPVYIDTLIFREAPQYLSLIPWVGDQMRTGFGSLMKSKIHPMVAELLSQVQNRDWRTGEDITSDLDVLQWGLGSKAAAMKQWAGDRAKHAWGSTQPTFLQGSGAYAYRPTGWHVAESVLPIKFSKGRRVEPGIPKSVIEDIGKSGRWNKYVQSKLKKAKRHHPDPNDPYWDALSSSQRRNLFKAVYAPYSSRWKSMEKTKAKRDGDFPWLE